MDGVTDVLDGDPVPEDDAVLKVGRVAGLLGVDPDQIQVLPQVVLELLQVQLHLTTKERRV